MKNTKKPLNTFLLRLSLTLLLITILISLRGITVIGPSETFAHNYGWQPLAIIVVITAGIAVYSRKDNKKLSNLILCLSVLLLLINVAISNLFTY
jgi:hypothetical protein